MQTKLGEKVSILVDRATDTWEGTTSDDKSKQKKRLPSNVKVSQPISQNNQISQSLGYSGSTPISQLPIAPQITKPQQSSQDYYQTNTFGAQQPQHASYMNNQMMESNEPVAANFGGSSFGSSF